MIAAINYIPGVTAIELIMLFNSLNISCILDTGTSIVHKRRFPASTPNKLLRVLVLSSPSSLSRYWKYLVGTPTRTMVCFIGSKNLYEEYCIEELDSSYIPISSSSVTSLIRSIIDIKIAVVEKPRRSVDTVTSVMQSNYRESLVQELHGAFYLIKDKELRNKLRHDTMLYLAGGLKEPPNTADHKKVHSIMQSGLVKKLRKAIKDSIKCNDIDKAAMDNGIDRFDIAYVRSKIKLK
jgi:hypothetical protein